MGAYEKLIPVVNSATLGQIPMADGNGSYTWGALDTDVYKTATVTIATSDWDNGSATAEVASVKSNSVVVLSPTPSSSETVTQNKVHFTTQGSGTLTFSAATTPLDSITYNAVVM